MSTTSKPKLRIGYVGCGFMAQKVHLPNLLSIENCEVVALAEVRQGLGKTVQERLGIAELYPDHRTMLEQADIDAVAVSAAFAVQGGIASDALAAGKDVFMEKPMAVSLAQADMILEAERKSGRRLMIGYMKRYDAGNELAKSTLDGLRSSGEAGAVTFARNHGFCGDWISGLDTQMDRSDEPAPIAPPPRPAWLPEEYLPAYLGYLQQYTHNINLLRWFLDAGDDVTIRSVDLDSDGYTGVVIFDMAGTRAILETGRLSYYRWDEHTQIYLEDAWVHAWAPPLLLRQAPAEVEVYRGGELQTFTRPIPQPAWSWSYKRELEHFVHAIQNGEPFGSTAQDTRTDVRLFEEIYHIFLEQQGVT